jgi:hypothetical protein
MVIIMMNIDGDLVGGMIVHGGTLMVMMVAEA